MNVSGSATPLSILTLIQARRGSTRFPDKVTKPLGDATILGQMLRRVTAAKSVGKVVVIATTSDEDRLLGEIAAAEGVETFFGDPLDLLDRHYQAWKHYPRDLVIKIPSDCPLIDPQVIDDVIAAYFAEATSHDYFSNLHPQSYPDGNDVEIMRANALERAWREATKRHEREHTTPYFWEGLRGFSCGNHLWSSGKDLSLSHRCVLDYPEDYALIQAVFAELSSQGIFGVDAIVNLMDKRPEIRELNRKYLGDAWYNRPPETKTQLTL